MLWALSFVNLIWVLAIVAIMTFLVIALVRHQSWGKLVTDRHLGLLSREVFSAITGAITFVIFALSVLNYTQWWRIAWTPNRLFDLNAVVYPDLNGKWHGSLSSNRKGEGPEDGNCPWLDQSGNRDKFGCYAVDVDVFMNLFEMTIKLTLGPAHSVSKGVSLTRDGDAFRITYLFTRNHPIDPEFNGAAILEGKVQEPGILDGHYWTDRDYQNLKQTAGYVHLEKSKP